MALTLFILVVVMLALIGVPALIVTVLLLAVLVAGGALVIALGWPSAPRCWPALR